MRLVRVTELSQLTEGCRVSVRVTGTQLRGARIHLMPEANELFICHNNPTQRGGGSGSAFARALGFLYAWSVGARSTRHPPTPFVPLLTGQGIKGLALELPGGPDVPQ